MASTSSQTDMGIGLGLVFGLVATAAIVVMGLTGYLYAVNSVAQVRITSGLAFGAAMLLAGLAIVAIHVYEA